MISRISLEVKEAILTLFRLPKSYMSSEYQAPGAIQSCITHGENQILHREFYLNPFFVRQRRPDKVRLGDGILVGVKDNFRLFIVDMQPTEKENDTREGSIARNCL